MGSMLQGYQRSKGFRFSRDRGFPLVDKGFQRVKRSKSKGFEGVKARVSSTKGDPGLITRSRSLEGHSKSLASKVSNPGASRLQGSKGSKHVGTYP